MRPEGARQGRSAWRANVREFTTLGEECERITSPLLALITSQVGAQEHQRVARALGAAAAGFRIKNGTGPSNGWRRVWSALASLSSFLRWIGNPMSSNETPIARCAWSLPFRGLFCGAVGQAPALSIPWRAWPVKPGHARLRQAGRAAPGRVSQRRICFEALAGSRRRHLLRQPDGWTELKKPEWCQLLHQAINTPQRKLRG